MLKIKKKNIFEIASEIKRLSLLGEKGEINEKDLKGGTITITNIGSIGGTYAKPILYIPEVAILAIGRMRKIPSFNEKNEVIPKNIVELSWSADHRVIDGATIAKFSNLIKNYIENPFNMIIDLK